MPQIARFLAVTGILVTGSSALGATVDLLLLAGQSNMVGQASASVRIPGIDPLDSEVAYYYDVTNTDGTFADDSGGTFGTLMPWRFGGPVTRFGPEMSLGRDLAGAGLNPALTKVATGGADIARFLPGAVDYTKLRAATIDSIAEIEAAGDSVNLLGLVWLQGESDAISTARADAYSSNLATFVGGWRSDLDRALPGRGFADLDLFLVEPADWGNGSSPGTAAPVNTAKVDQALIGFAAVDANAWFIPTDDFTTFGDGLIHFGVGDQLTLGSRIAEAILARAIPEPATGVSVCLMLLALVDRRSLTATA